MQLRYRKKKVHRGRYFRRSLTLVLFIACIPGIVTGVVLYGWLTGSMERTLRQADQEQLEHRAALVAEQLDDLELSFSKWAFDPVFDSRLKSLDFVYKYKQVHELYKTLLIIQDSNVLIDEVELYLQQPEPLTLTPYRYDFLRDPSQRVTFGQLVEEQRMTYWTRSADGKSMMEVIQLTGDNGLPFGALTMTLDTRQLGNLLQSLSPYPSSASFLLGAEGEWIVPPASGGEDGLYAAMRSRVLDADAEHASLLMSYGGKEYSVKYGTVRRLGTDWTYVSSVPLSDIAAPMLSASKIIVAVNAAGLLLALLLSWFGSLHLYRPVGRFLHTFKGERPAAAGGGQDEFGQIEQQWLGLKQEREMLLGNLEQQLPVVRKSFVLQLAQGHLAGMAEQELRERFARLSWEVGDCRFAAVFAQLSPYGMPSQEGADEHRDLLVFAAGDVLKDILEEGELQGEIIHFHDQSMGLLLALSGNRQDEAAESGRELMILGERWVKEVQARLGIRLTAAVSECTESAAAIPYLFRKIRYSLRHSLLASDQAVIDAGQAGYAAAVEETHYPVFLEQEIVAAIRSADAEAAMELLQRFMEEVQRGGSEQRLKQALLQLLASIQHAMTQLGGDPVLLFEVEVFDELLHLNSSDDVLLWFRHRIVKLCIEGYTGKEEEQLKLAVHSMKEHADQQYAEAMSLEALADLYGIHSYTLSRAFKQMIGQNFVDYLTEVRLRRAKQLIEETDGKINEIAEQVGYQASYFNRIFKKSEGITPSRYRDRIRSSEKKRGNGSE
ncbi:AraC family transcriptional regulator [Paenibacillus sp. S150]|uniref:AraC family transcriptional regulator n=1 Tax=Paenibacillus sp. S150 TaxID=2749826 RepID=UPI001C582AE7|nr:AraC family transcriptional regulator [Paenibacillus sp. S150]MBW4082643.1 AraC family transcriptional regulator [Paenibacillus sp. S150]